MKIRSDFIVIELEEGDVITEKCFCIFLGVHHPCTDAIGKVWKTGFRRCYQLVLKADE